MKIFTAGMLTESSDLTPIPTTEREWKIERPGDANENSTLFRSMLTLFREMAEAKGWDVAESICATALPPGGRTVRAVYENLRSMILDDLQRAMPVDGVLIQLHGAAMAHGYDDCEGDLLEHIRNMIGPDIPIGVELDPHCHMTAKMVNNATAMILYKTFLHTDIKERAVELFDLIADTIEGRVKPVMALFDCRMIDGFDEQYEPMKSLLEKVYARERQDDILSISPVHGFGMANVADMGSKMLVVTDDDLKLARETAEELGKVFYGARGQMMKGGEIGAELEQAQERANKGEKAIQLVEFSDLAGCGFPTDGTELLGAMFERGMTNVAVGLVWDPMAVSICHDVGPEAELMMRIGGKASPLSGTPMDLNVIVERIFKDVVIDTWVGDISLGDAAVVRSGDTELILVSRRVLGYDLQVFRDLGVEPSDKQYLLLKYVHEHNNAIFIFGSSLDHRNWPFTCIARPKWPWDMKPFDFA